MLCGFVKMEFYKIFIGNIWKYALKVVPLHKILKYNDYGN